MELWKKHWTTALGALFVLASLITLFKYSSDQGWITDPIKVAAGLIVGAAAGAVGTGLHRKGGSAALAGEIGAGLGSAILYATAAFAGVYTTLWEPMTVLIVMIAISAASAGHAYYRHSRLLMSVSLVGAMFAPLVMRPETDQVLQLFLYLLVINSAAFFISAAKRWIELRWSAFGFTWLLYAVYYVHFDPISDSWHSMPMRYLIAAFAFYLIAFYAAAWKERSGFLCADVYISFANTVIFGAWAAGLLPERSQMTVLLLLVGAAYAVLAVLLYRFKETSSSARAGYIHAAFGVIALLIGLSGIGTGSEYRPIIGVFVWTAIAAIMVLIGRNIRKDLVILAGTFTWIATGLYWFGTAWDVPRINPFGSTYIPFLNGGALAWIGLAALGFYMSRQVRFVSVDKETSAILAVLYAVASHMIVGGLLSIQVINVFEEYTLSGSVNLTLSVVWAIHALLLFLWGAYSSQRPFRWFGTVVLVLVAGKAILFDLSGESSPYKMVVFLLLGAISFGISWINAKWRTKAQ